MLSKVGKDIQFLLLLCAITVSCQENKSPSCPCTRELNIVCGTDGNSYNNPCLLKCAATADPNLKLAYKGPCFFPGSQYCPCPYIYAPVCGSDGITYGNQCSFNCAKLHRRDLVLKKQGECDEAQTSS